MRIEELITALRRLKVETGSLPCLGCGYEHGCSLHGCVIINEALERITMLKEHFSRVRSSMPAIRCGCSRETKTVCQMTLTAICSLR